MISLQLQNLTTSYGYKPVFEKISLSHKSGILGVAGPNGSGKSTLLKCMGGLLQPDSGRIIWKKDSQELMPHDLKPFLGYSAPYISLYKELSVRENLQFLARLRQANLGSQKLARLLDFVDLASAGNRLFIASRTCAAFARCNCAELAGEKRFIHRWAPLVITSTGSPSARNTGLLAMAPISQPSSSAAAAAVRVSFESPWTRLSIPAASSSS